MIDDYQAATDWRICRGQGEKENYKLSTGGERENKDIFILRYTKK